MLTEERRKELKWREGESPKEWEARTDALAEKWRREYREQLAAESEERAVREARPSDTLVISRTENQERAVEKAVSAFEAEKKRLYRDGVKLFSDEEHTRRLGELTEDLREKVEAVASEAAADAEGYEREALALSYQDPLTNLTVSERERVSASMPLVREDCETMALASLVERIRAVAAGTEKPSKFLHARYGLRRYEMETARLDEASRSTGEAPALNIDLGALRELRTAAEKLAQELRDPADERGREAFRQAATKSRRLVATSRSKLNEADGTADLARREHSETLRAAL